MRRLGPFLLASVLVSGLVAGCTSGSSDGGAAPSTSSTAATTTSSTAVDEGPQTVVRIVADSEVADQVAELLDQEPDITVASHRSADGATMAELDPTVATALAEHPDVLVYAGGTNDLSAGPLEMLSGLEQRLTSYAQQTCVVLAVPVFRYERGTPAEVTERTKGTRLLEDAATKAGAHVASYLDVSLAMDEAGEDFFAEGELGELHPGPQSYLRIATAIAEQVRACR